MILYVNYGFRVKTEKETGKVAAGVQGNRSSGNRLRSLPVAIWSRHLFLRMERAVRRKAKF